MNKRVHLYISGRVQGVFFRARTKDTADRLSLSGWVRNLTDGRVEAVFEGNSDAIDQMIVWCRKGPPFSSVTSVELTEEPFTKEFTGFDIRY